MNWSEKMRLQIRMLVSLGCFSIILPARAIKDAPVFEKDIQPVLANKCGKCHGGKVRKGGLTLSSMEGIRRGGESDEAVVGKSLKDSLLWKMIDEGEMPPEGKTPLSKKEVTLIRRWIESGAPSEKASAPFVKAITQHDVLPIVLLRCTACHGPQKQLGGLDLRTPTAMRRGGKSGPALVPGKPESSRMIQRIESQACPPRQLLLKYFVQRPSSMEVKTLRDWITAGAPEVDVPVDVASTEPDHLVTNEDRKHWAFQPPKDSPGVQSIDDFIRKKLKAKGLAFSPEANRATLIRRAYLDLLGMPPSLDEWNGWNSSNDPDWYRRMIDHLLDSPHYGERWGRYWLDLAGYADSEGGVSADPVRRVAWKYRDYVIRSFNNDKPYNRFLREQIAGDELIDHQNASEITDVMVENLVATGFLRMGIDQTGSRTMNFVPERLGVIADVIKVLGSGVMGLTMECARCHSHKYDPIPHRDYYRFKAIFQGALDEHDWMSFKTRMLNVTTPRHQKRLNSVNPPLEAKLKALERQLKEAMNATRIEVLRQHYPNQTETDRKATLVALRRADNQRTLPQRILVEKLQRAEVLADLKQPKSVLNARQAVVGIEVKIAKIHQQMEPPSAIRALWDRGRPSPVYILHRGEYDKPGRLVGPGVPSVLTDGKTPFEVKPPFPHGTFKTGRRLAFARWLTRPDNLLTTRVMVNRIWYHHFGAGLVRTLENFGVKGERPSHPELLDWLAVQFIQRDWSIKAMHRLIMNSQTYRQSSRITSRQIRLDPQNRLLSRMTLRRMNAEALRDSLLFVSGKLNDTPGGPPDPMFVDRNGLVSVKPGSDGGWRRSVYLRYRRTEIPSIMDTFDYPVMGPNCVARNLSTVSTQPLMLMNNQHVRELTGAFAERIETLLGKRGQSNHGARVDLVYHFALSHPPSAEERRIGIDTLKQLEIDWRGKPKAALETYCHTILNSAAFLYVD